MFFRLNCCALISVVTCRYNAFHAMEENIKDCTKSRAGDTKRQRTLQNTATCKENLVSLFKDLSETRPSPNPSSLQANLARLSRRQNVLNDISLKLAEFQALVGPAGPARQIVQHVACRLRKKKAGHSPTVDIDHTSLRL